MLPAALDNLEVLSTLLHQVFPSRRKKSFHAAPAIASHTDTGVAPLLGTVVVAIPYAVQAQKQRLPTQHARMSAVRLAFICIPYTVVTHVSGKVQTLLTTIHVHAERGCRLLEGVDDGLNCTHSRQHMGGP